ncbi:MAG: MFS transporter [Bacteroidia bacterium]
MLKNERIVLFILAALQFTHIMDFMIMMPLSVHLIPQFKITPQQFSFIVSSYALSAFVSSLSASFVVDKFDRKKVLLLGYMGFIVGTFACGFAPTYYLLMAARIFAGFFGGLIAAQVLSIVGDLIPYERRGRAMGILFTGFSAASVAGVPTGIYLADHFNWHVPFILVGCLGLIIIPMVIIYLPKMTHHLDANYGDKENIFKVIYNDSNLQIGMLMMFTLVLAHFVVIPFLAQYMESNVGFSKAQIAWIYFVGGASSIVSSPIIGRLSDRFGKFRVFYILIILSWIPVFLITNMPRIPIYYVLIAVGFFFVFAGGRYIPAQALITSVIEPKHRGGFMNVNSSTQNMATGLASLVAGLIVTTLPSGELGNYNYVGYFAIAVSIICMAVASKLKMKTGI